MRGKVSDMQAKLQSCQSRAKSSHQEIQDLRGALASSQRWEEETSHELERSAGQIRAYEEELEELQQLPVLRAELQCTAADLADLWDRHRATEAL